MHRNKNASLTISLKTKLSNEHVNGLANMERPLPIYLQKLWKSTFVSVTKITLHKLLSTSSPIQPFSGVKEAMPLTLTGQTIG